MENEVNPGEDDGKRQTEDQATRTGEGKGEEQGQAPVDINAPFVLKLTKPVIANGVEVAELSFREPTAAEIELVGFPLTWSGNGIQYEPRKMTEMMAMVAVVPPSTIRALTSRNWQFVAMRFLAMLTPREGMREEQWPIDLPLIKPISSEGKEITKLTLREPTGGDIERCGNPLRLDRPSIDEPAMTAMISLLSKVPVASIREMGGKDWATAAFRLLFFFGPSES